MLLLSICVSQEVTESHFCHTIISNLGTLPPLGSLLQPGELFEVVIDLTDATGTPPTRTSCWRRMRRSRLR